MRAVMELRNATWFTDDNQAETLDFLRRHHLPYVSVDMPQGHTSSVPPVLAATADLSVVRFHGHSDKWTSRDIQEKYGYDYSDRELRGWVPKLRKLSQEVAEVHVLMNNCRGDSAQRNAATLLGMLET